MINMYVGAVGSALTIVNFPFSINHYYPLIPVMLMPSIKLRWATMKMMMTGNATIVLTAIK